MKLQAIEDLSSTTHPNVVSAKHLKILLQQIPPNMTVTLTILFLLKRATFLFTKMSPWARCLLTPFNENYYKHEAKILYM